MSEIIIAEGFREKFTKAVEECSSCRDDLCETHESIRKGLETPEIATNTINAMAFFLKGLEQRGVTSSMILENFG